MNANWSFNPTDLTWHPNLLEVETLVSWALAGAGLIFLHKQRTGIKGDKIVYPEEMNFPGNPVDPPKLWRDPDAQLFLVRREPSI